MIFNLYLCELLMADLGSHRNHGSMVRRPKSLTRQGFLPFTSIKRRLASALIFGLHMGSLLEWNPTFKQILQSFSELITKILLALKLNVRFN